MCKFFKTLLSLAVILVITASMFTVGVSAANDTIISFSKSKVNVGDNVSVTVTVSESKIYSVDISVSYDEKVLKYVSGASEGGGGEVKIVEALSGENKKSFVINFKAAKAGSCVISARGSVGAGIPSTDINLTGASATMTVNDVSLSANANLQSLTVSSGNLSPRFSSSKTSYSVDVKKSVTSCKIYATTADPDAKVSVSGSSTLKIGANKRTVTVTAPSGAQKVYTVVINRSNVDEQTSSVESTTSAIEEEDPLDVIIDGVSYKVISNIKKIEIPKGFKVSKRLFNGVDVTVAVDDESIYELFYLTSADGETVASYQYDEESNAFQRVYVISQGDKQYIVSQIPEGFAIPEGYYETNANIQDMVIKCYASTDIADMYYIYCYYNGKSSMYRYDTIEDVLQRSPEFRLVTAENKLENKTSNSFIARFESLSTNAKTVVVCLAIGLIGILVMIILLICKLVISLRNKNNNEDDDNFDAVKLNENFEIVSDDK